MSEYWDINAINAGKANKTVFEGRLRVNPKQHKDAYVTNECFERDILIHDLKDRNRAFHDDIVAVYIPDVVPDGPQFNGKVVKIIKSDHAKYLSGHLKPIGKKSKTVQFQPRNRSYPQMIVERNDLVERFAKKNPLVLNDTLFLCTLNEWPINSTLPHGTVIEYMGKAGNVQTELAIMIKEHNIIDEEFDQLAKDCLPSNLPWSIPSEEYNKRKDLRNRCIFTIDPATARDLDDALSCIDNADGTWNVGVHIADVSYFIKEDSPLDIAARDRATSVYFAHRVIPMLPRTLCEELCSLNPGQDRLSYSVEWTINRDGEIIDTNFNRSIIRSCAKLSYEHAQLLLDNALTDDKKPDVHGNFDMLSIGSSIKQLWSIAKILRNKRIENGALKLTQPKLFLKIDKDLTPIECVTYKLYDTNSLVEEFMLLANISVAEFISTKFPDHAVLRRHPEPDMNSLIKAGEICNKCEVSLDCIDSKSIQESIDTIAHGNGDNGWNSKFAATTFYCSKAMKLAQYFCSSSAMNADYSRHYALAVPVYTHFTSPIRRYPDIMVHRQLSAALSNSMPNGTTMSIGYVTEHCNGRRLSAKRVQDGSIELYFKQYIMIQGSFTTEAVVVGIMDKSIDILLSMCRNVYRVHQDKMLSLWGNWIYENAEKSETSQKILFTYQGSTEQHQLKYFSKVDVTLTAEDGNIVARITAIY